MCIKNVIYSTEHQAKLFDSLILECDDDGALTLTIVDAATNTTASYTLDEEETRELEYTLSKVLYDDDVDFDN